MEMSSALVCSRILPFLSLLKNPGFSCRCSLIFFLFFFFFSISAVDFLTIV